MLILNPDFQLFQSVIAAEPENQNLRFIPVAFMSPHFLIF